MPQKPNRSAGVRVLIADDHMLVRTGLRTVLEKSPRVNIVGEADTAAQTLELVARLQPQVVLLDISFPDGSGLDVCREITLTWPATRVIMLTVFDDAALVAESICAGAAGYLLKRGNLDRLTHAVDIVAQQGSYLDSELTHTALALVKGHVSLPASSPLAGLSRQERRMVPLVSEGKTNKEIAQAMNLSEKTIKNYLVRLFRKLSVTRRAQVAALFATHTSSSLNQPGAPSRIQAERRR